MDKIRISGQINDSIVDGPGLRYVIFTQGCLHNCLGCHNPQTHDVNGGTLVDIEEIKANIAKNGLLDGITFSGGEPFLQPKECANIALWAKNRGMNIISFSGYTYEQLLKMDNVKEFLDLVDILIDGPFVLKEKSLNISYRGSRNQRVIDMNETRKQKKVILFIDD